MRTVQTHGTTEGLLTHVAAADCFIARPHPALECGIATAWWRSQSQVDPGTALLHLARSPEGC
jgi:hypothetical protein